MCMASLDYLTWIDEYNKEKKESRSRRRIKLGVTLAKGSRKSIVGNEKQKNGNMT